MDFDEKKAKEQFDSYKNQKVSEEDLKKASQKANFLNDLKDDFLLLIEMLKACWDGEFDIPIFEIGIISATILYVLSPLDALPDFIPLAGFIDDGSMVALALGTLKATIERYKEYKKSKKYR